MVHLAEGQSGMQLKTILNRVHKCPGFVYKQAKLLKSKAAGLVLHILVVADARTKPVCSGCGAKGPGYDTLEERMFEFVPLWGIQVFLLYAMRRVSCAKCGVTVEAVPWAAGKSHITKAYAWFLAAWAKRLSWLETARAFKTSWETVYRSVEKAVEWGLAHRDLSSITAIGFDEVFWKKPYKFLTVVYEIASGRRRLLWVGQDRTMKTTLRFFRWLGKQRSAQLEWICSDMWKPYLRVIAKKASQAVHVLDRFHIMAKMNKAIDEVRAQEAKAMRAKGLAPLLKNSRWCLLKRPENRNAMQKLKFAELVRHNLRSVRACLQKEVFQHFWDYRHPGWAIGFLDRWCAQVMRSRIEPMKKVARTLRTHRLLLLNWFKARGQIALGAVEGMNNKLKVITRRAYGFRTYRATEIALYHTLGDLPDPQSELTHRFC
jgi:transposase